MSWHLEGNFNSKGFGSRVFFGSRNLSSHQKFGKNVLKHLKSIKYTSLLRSVDLDGIVGPLWNRSRMDRLIAYKLHDFMHAPHVSKPVLYRPNDEIASPATKKLLGRSYQGILKREALLYH